MADDDYEESSSDEELFDPATLDDLTDKEKRKWAKDSNKWRIFMDFIVRHVAIATFKYNYFESRELEDLLNALDCAEKVRGKMKLKKREEPRISSFKMMRDITDIMVKERMLHESNQIRRFLDIAGRVRGIALIAGDFYKSLKKGNVRGQRKIKHYLDFWKGFTVRSFDYSQLQFKGVNTDSFTSLERRFLVWPTAVRTALHLAQKFLKRAADATGLNLISPDPKTIQKHMQAVEFVLATKIEDMLFKRMADETRSFGFLGGLAMSATSVSAKRKGPRKFELPDLEGIDPSWMKPIPDGSMLLRLPSDPPKDSKKGGRKSGKKGKGKGKGKGKSRAGSPKAHKKKKK